MAIALCWRAWAARGTLIGGGEQPDWTGTIWTYWWTARALADGMNPADGVWDFFPVGVHPVAQYNLLDALLAAPLFWVMGPIAAYNVFVVLVLTSSAVAFDHLCRRLGALPLAGALAGVGLELSTFMGFEIYEGRVSQALLAPMLLALIGLHRLARGEGGLGLVAGTGALVAATFLGYWYYGFFLVIGAACLWLAELPRRDGRAWGRLGAAAAITTALTAPFVLGLLRAYAELPGVVRALEEGNPDYGGFGRGLFGLNMAIHQSLWPGWPLWEGDGPADDHRVALVLLGLAAAALLLRAPGSLRWLAVTLTGWGLSLGPWLREQDGTPLPWRLPYLWLYDHVPFMDRLWWPKRFTVLAFVGIGVLAALGLSRLLLWARARGRALPAALALLVALGLGWDLRARNVFLPFASEVGPPVTRALYARLEGPLLTVPVLGKDPTNRFLLWFQIFHGQPILSGLGAHLQGHRPAGYEAYIRANGLLDALRAASEGEEGGQTVRRADVEVLRRDGFAWAVVDPMAFSDFGRGEMTRVFSQIFIALWGPPDIPQGSTAAWRIAPLSANVTLPPRPAREQVIRASEGSPSPAVERAPAGGQDDGVPPPPNGRPLVKPAQPRAPGERERR